ncbi:MAG: bifunctional diguanylate cyclase/phosphodiesterase, partial [Rhodospirillales bacterium]
GRLKASVRQMDTVARLGGDEFVVILGDVRLRTDAEAVAAKITEACTRPFLVDGQELFVTLSVGVAAFPEDGDDAEALLHHADAAMYVGKQNGRGQVRFFTPELRQRSHDRIRQEVALRHALERGELTLHYQPLIEIRSGEVVGAEALLRWIDPEHGKTSSHEFVRLAEDTGLIVPIGEWVLATGCRELRRWIDAGHPRLGLSINVSGRQFRGGSLPAAVRGMLRDYRLDPQALTLEITESLLTEDPGEFKPTMDRLVTEGVRLAVDDFGTGYASLSYLNRVPLDALKIDRSYTSGMLDDASRSTLVDALIILAHRLQLRVVAEGVETAGQLDFLRAHGCDLAQGYFFSAPLPADDFLQLLDPAALNLRRLAISDEPRSRSRAGQRHQAAPLHAGSSGVVSERLCKGSARVSWYAGDVYLTDPARGTRLWRDADVGLELRGAGPQGVQQCRAAALLDGG